MYELLYVCTSNSVLVMKVILLPCAYSGGIHRGGNYDLY